MRLKLETVPSSRRSPGGVCLQPLELRMESDSRRNLDGVFLQLKSGAKSGSRRSPDGAYRPLKLVTEPGSRRSPSGVLLGVEVVGGARLP